MLLRLFLATRVPKVWTVHTLVPNVASLRGDLRVSAIYLSAVDVAVWHSQRTLDEARKRFAELGLPTSWHAKDVLIPCVSFNGHFPNTASKVEARRRLGLDPSHFVVGHFGPSGRYKGTERVLELAKITPEVDIRFVIFGRCNEPALAQKIRAAAQAHTNLKVNLDFIPDEELQVWFNACDVVVQPYLDITTAGSVMFAFAFRRPIIASPLGNIPDLVRPDETGWLASSPEDLRRCILVARASPKATAEMGEMGFELADRMANVDSTADRYAKAYALAVAA
jgi:glycosyltransferase involved in cell wall biosynthesis